MSALCYKGGKADKGVTSGANCIKIGLPRRSILRDYFQENRTSRRPLLLLRISFPGRPIFIQLVPGPKVATDPKITARRYDSDKGSVSFIVFVFPIRYNIKAAQQDSAFKMTHI